MAPRPPVMRALPGLIVSPSEFLQYFSLEILPEKVQQLGKRISGFACICILIEMLQIVDFFILPA